MERQIKDRVRQRWTKRRQSKRDRKRDIDGTELEAEVQKDGRRHAHRRTQT